MSKQDSVVNDRDFTQKLWAASEKLRSHMDAAEYKHVVLGLIFLKYISDAFESRRQQLDTLMSDPGSDYYEEDPEYRDEVREDRDEYVAYNVFWVPKEARWPTLSEQAKLPGLGKRIDDAMAAIEEANPQRRPKLKGVLPKNYARLKLENQRLGELVDLISSIGFTDRKHQPTDVLGRVYEYFLGQFASAEGKRGGQFYTPACIVRLLVKMLSPMDGRIYDPCCGSGGMFIQSDRFVSDHGGKRSDISLFGQESNPTTRWWKMTSSTAWSRCLVSSFLIPKSLPVYGI